MLELGKQFLSLLLLYPVIRSCRSNHLYSIKLSTHDENTDNRHPIRPSLFIWKITNAFHLSYNNTVTLENLTFTRLVTTHLGLDSPFCTIYSGIKMRKMKSNFSLGHLLCCVCVVSIDVEVYSMDLRNLFLNVYKMEDRIEWV